MTKIFLIIVSLCIYGCIKKPIYESPKINLPKSFNQNVANDNVLINKIWWKNFGSNELNEIIERGLKNNSDLLIAVSNIDKYRAKLAISKANNLPQIQVNASSNRNSLSARDIKTQTTKPINIFTLSSSLSYQLDFFSKLKNLKESDKALLLSAESSRDNLELTISSEIAKSFYNLIFLKYKYNNYRDMIQIQEEILKMSQDKYIEGIIDLASLNLIDIELKDLDCDLNNIAQELSEQESALKTLIGFNPDEIINLKLDYNTDIILKSINSVDIPNILPSRLILNRPDIKEAESNLVSRNALLDVARAGYFPDISLGSVYGNQSSKMRYLFDNAQMWQLKIDSLMPIFDFGKTKSNIIVARSDQKQALQEYIQTVRTAFREVIDSLSLKENNLKNKLQIINKYIIIEENTSIANVKYDNGIISLIDLMKSKQESINSSIELAKSKQELFNSEVDIFKSIAGSW